ncbi:hypothetical protein IKO70_08805 [bacterium]|jgi:hypothetical protein|nr:hypothetical protein [bacterium]
MKSKNFIEKILFILLLSALALFVACSSSDEDKEELTDTEADSSDIDTTPDSGDSTDDSADTTPYPADTTPDGTDSTGDSDEPAGDNDTEPTNDDDTDTEPTEPTEPTNPTEPEPTDEPDPEFEQNAEGCTMIEVPTITMSGYPDEINGYFSPAMGGNAIDIIKIFLMGDLKEGTYELGTGVNDNYSQCQQCVMVWVDAELAAAKEYYFQTAGTLQITKVAGEGDAQRTNGNIKNLILKQAEDNLDYIFISNGKCIAAKSVEWETITDDPSTPGND